LQGCGLRGKPGSHISCSWEYKRVWGNCNDFWFLMVGNQIANMICSLSFGHNLCFKCWNGSCKPILNISVSRAFQWYKEFFNAMGFDPYNCSLNIRKSIEIPTPKMGVHLGVWRFIPSHSLTLPWAWDVTPGLPSWPTPLQALALVMSPRLGLRHVKYPTKHKKWTTYTFVTTCRP